MIKYKMIRKFAPIISVLLLQIISCIWYLLPNVGHAHVPGEFIRMLIFGGITLFVLMVTILLYFVYKPTTLIWKIPFVISFGMILLAWFYK